MVLPEVILFDLDGTLIDSSEVVVDAYRAAMLALDYEPPSRDLIASLAGKSTHDTAEGMGAKPEDYSAIDQFFWDYFNQYAQETTSVPVYRGVLPVLTYLQQHGIPMGIVTSNEARSAQLLMETAGLSHYFRTFVGKEDLAERKPHPAPLLLALERLNYRGQSAWFVGDTSHDVRAAQSARMVSVAIPRRSTYDQVILSEPDYLLSSFAELIPLLKDLNVV